MSPDLPLRQRGLTAMETLLVLAAGALAVLGAIILFQSLILKQRVGASYEQIVGLVSAVHEGTIFGQRQRNYDLDNNGNYDDIVGFLRQTRGLPADMDAPDGTLRNPWKGIVTVEGGPSNFVIGYASLPVDACIQLAVGLDGRSSEGLRALTINGDTTGAGGARFTRDGTGAGSLPPSIDQVQAACDQPGLGNSVAWTFE